MIVQSGKYNEVLEAGMDFKALVAAHETSLELVDVETNNESNTPLEVSKSPRYAEENGEDKSTSDKGESKLIKEEERETGKVSLRVYKQYATEAFGWWGVLVVFLFSFLWQGSMMASDYWLAYETSADRVTSFNPSLFIEIYGIIAVVSALFIVVRMYFVTLMGLKTSQIFFGKILHSILHAPMSFFDTTPSGRILSRVTF